MQAPTHLVTGVLIQKALEKKKVQPFPLQYLLVAFLAVISHGILDRLARFTYHPSVPLTGDWFWISYHSIVAFLTIFIFVKYWKRYKIGLIFSVLPDFDWVVINASSLFSFQIPFWKEPILHKFLFSFLDFLPPFGFLNTLPDWTLERKAVILELALFITLITIIYVLGKGKMNVDKEKIEKPALTVQEGEDTKSNNEKNSNWINILPIYQACMNQEQSIRTSYQSLLTALEVGLFALAIGLYELELGDYFWLLAMLGIFLCLGFGIACEYYARNADIWRIRVVKLVSGTEVEDAFREGKYRWIPLGKVGFKAESSVGHWFERILIPIMLGVWLSVLWYFPIRLPIFIPTVVRVIFTIMTFSGMLYVFHCPLLDRLIESKAGYYDYRRGKSKSK